MSPAPSVQLAQAQTALLLASVSQATTAGTTGVDLIDFEGVVSIVANIGVITGGLTALSVQFASTQGGSYGGDINFPALTTGTVQVITTNISDVNRWCRVVVTTGTSVLLGVHVVGFKKYK